MKRRMFNSPKKVKKIFHKIKLSRQLKRYFFLLISGILLLFVTFIIIYRFINTKINNANNEIVAPYYDKSVFQKPPDLNSQINSTLSSIMKDQVSMRIPIIMYHYVENVIDDNDLIRKKMNINPNIFESQLKAFIKEGFETFFVKDIPDILNAKTPYSVKQIFLTFDDGYEDFYKVAFPILKKYNMKSTIYIMYNFLGRKGYLNIEEVKELLKSGLVEVGSHTLDHSYLKQAPLTLAEREIVENKSKLEELFGVKIQTFAYPYGAFSKETVKIVEDAGYTAAVSVIPGINQSNENLFYLSRLRAGMFSGASPSKILERVKN